jgi:hypothetical protein
MWLDVWCPYEATLPGSTGIRLTKPVRSLHIAGDESADHGLEKRIDEIVLRAEKVRTAGAISLLTIKPYFLRPEQPPTHACAPTLTPRPVHAPVDRRQAVADPTRPEIVEAIMYGKNGPEMALARVLKPFIVEWIDQSNHFDGPTESGRS